jgi:hypothetical protein
MEMLDMVITRIRFLGRTLRSVNVCLHQPDFGLCSFVISLFLCYFIMLLLSNRYSIVMQSLGNRYAILIQSLSSRYSVLIRSLFTRYSVVNRWLFSRYSVVLQLLLLKICVRISFYDRVPNLPLYPITYTRV